MTLKRTFNGFIILMAALIGGAVPGGGEWEVKDPVLPESPEIVFNDPGEFRYKASVEMEGAKKIQGNLLLNVDRVVFSCKIDNDIRTDEIGLNEIASVEITSWLPNKSKGDRYLFYPSDMKLRLKKGGDYSCTVPKIFWKLTLAAAKGRKYCYTYFFEFWDKDRWGNSGNSEFSHPMKHPLKGTARKILFSTE